jgi:hypothetical protein
MKRTLLALCLSLVAGLAFAGDVTRSSGEGANLCPKAVPRTAAAAPIIDAGTPVPAPTPAVRARATGGGGGALSTHMTSPRWHTLLPGMFR